MYRNILIFLISLFFITSCSKESREGSKSSDHKYGGSFTIGVADIVETLDPINVLYSSDWMATNLIYEGLVKYGNQFDNIEPALANDWDISTDGKTYTFHLRNDVYFQSDPCFPNGKGKQFTAEDVLYSFTRIADPSLPSPQKNLFLDKIEGMRDFYNGKIEYIKGISVIDGFTIEFTLTKPYVVFLKLLAAPTSLIVCKQAIECYGEEYSYHPIGTGAFKMVYWSKWKELRFTRNNNYWRKNGSRETLPFLENITMRIVKHDDMLQELLKGNLQFIKLGAMQFNKYNKDPDLLNKFNFTKTSCATGTRFWGFSMDRNSQLNIKSVRRYIANAFKKYTIENFDPSLPKAAVSLAPSHFFKNQTQKAINNNTATDLRLKNENIEISSTINTSGSEILQNILTQVGANPTTNIKSNHYYNYVINERPHLFRVSMIPAYPDLEEYYSLFYSKNGSSINLCNYVNPQYDNLFEKTMLEADEAKRINIFIELENILTEDAPLIYVSHADAELFITPQNIKGINLSYITVDFNELWIDTENAEK